MKAFYLFPKDANIQQKYMDRWIKTYFKFSNNYKFINITYFFPGMRYYYNYH